MFLRNFNYSDGYFATRIAEKFMSVGVLSGDSKKFTSNIFIIFPFFVEYYLQLLVYYATFKLEILIILSRYAAVAVQYFCFLPRWYLVVFGYARRNRLLKLA